MTIAAVNKYYEDEFEKYGITHLIIPKNTRLNIFISRDDSYKQLYKDDHFLVYERTTSKNN